MFKTKGTDISFKIAQKLTKFLYRPLSLYHTSKFSGPGTKIEIRVARGDLGINPAELTISATPKVVCWRIDPNQTGNYKT